jgi:hypothetical protein
MSLTLEEQDCRTSAAHGTGTPHNPGPWEFSRQRASSNPQSIDGKKYDCRAAEQWDIPAYIDCRIILLAAVPIEEPVRFAERVLVLKR